MYITESNNLANTQYIILYRSCYTAYLPDSKSPGNQLLCVLDSTLKCNRATKEYLKGRLEVKAFTWSFI